MYEKVAVVFSLFNIDAYRITMLQTVLQQLQQQTISFYSHVILLNESKNSPHYKHLSLVADCVQLVDGNPYLFQKEALCNVALQCLPAEIEKIIFLDSDIFPVDIDWLEKTCTLLNSHDVVQPYSVLFYLDKSATQKVISKPTERYTSNDLINPKHLGFCNRSEHTESMPIAQPSFAFTRGLPVLQSGAAGGAIAFNRVFLNKIGGLPYEDIFAGLNDVLLFYNLSLQNVINKKIFSPSLIEKYSNNVQCKFSFTPRRLYHLWHKPGKLRGYGDRAETGVKLQYNYQEDIHLNSSGGIELTKKGHRLEKALKSIEEKYLRPDPAI